VRGDAGASIALQRAVEITQTPAVKARLLRLMALNGSPEHLPVLLESFEKSPHFDTLCWALSGRSENVSCLVKALGHPECAERVEDDWLFLTGAILPQRPALMLVDEQGDIVAPNPEQEKRLKMVPDSHFAQAWWEAHRADWGDQRWIMGQAADEPWLLQLCRDYTGKRLDDLMGMLSLKLKRPLGVRSYSGWQTQRLQELNAVHREFSKTDSVSLSG
jgi:hypothetical protein